MKKTILTLVFLSTIAVSNAQDKPSKVKFGVKGGLNISSAVFDETLDTDAKSKTGIHLGVFTNIPMGKKFAFQPEALFSMQGFNQYYNEGTYVNDSDVNLNYLSIPLNFQFKFIDKVFIEAGPYFDFLLSAKADVTSKNVYTEVVTTQDNVNVKEYYKTMVFGINFGGGYHINNQISVNARYYMGLSPSDNSNFSYTYETISTNNRLFQLGVGYTF